MLLSYFDNLTHSCNLFNASLSIVFELLYMKVEHVKIASVKILKSWFSDDSLEARPSVSAIRTLIFLPLWLPSRILSLIQMPFVQAFTVDPTWKPNFCLSSTLLRRNDFPVLYNPAIDIIAMGPSFIWLRKFLAAYVNSYSKVLLLSGKFSKCHMFLAKSFYKLTFRYNCSHWWCHN